MQRNDRVPWVDAARALSVIAVVLMHTTIWAVIPGGSVQAFVEQLLLPQTILWYLLALAWWTAVLALLHRIPALPMILGLHSGDAKGSARGPCRIRRRPLKHRVELFRRDESGVAA